MHDRPSPTASRRRAQALLTLATVATALLAAGTARGAPAVTGEFALPSQPGHLTNGPDGNVWVTLAGVDDLARITPDGTVTSFDVPGVASVGGVSAGPDGNLWLTFNGGVVRVPPDDPASAVSFAIPTLTAARAIVQGTDGNLWTASGDRVFRIPPASPAMPTSFPVTDLDARGVAAADDGHIWVADFGGTTNGRLVRVAPDGDISAIPVGGGVIDVAAGPNGGVGFTNPLAIPQFIGQASAGGPVRPVPTPGADPFGVARAADGAYWTANFAQNTLGRLAFDGTYTTLGGFSAGAGPRFLTASADGQTLWVGLETVEKVARVTGVEPPSASTPLPGGATTPAAPIDRIPPRILRLSASPKRFRAGSRLRPPRAGRPGVATRVTIVVSEPSTARLRLLRVRHGWRTGNRCRAGQPPRKAQRCLREQLVQSRTLRVAKRRRLTLTGRVGRRALATGRYRLRVTATDAAGNPSAARTIALRIVR